MILPQSVWYPVNMRRADPTSARNVARHANLSCVSRFNDTRHPVSRRICGKSFMPPPDPLADVADAALRQQMDEITSTVCEQPEPLPGQGRLAAILRIADNDYRKRWPDIEMVLRNQAEYCLRHGLQCLNDISNYTDAIYFRKPHAIKRALHRLEPGDWLMWADTDVLILNQTQTPAQLLEATTRAQQHNANRPCNLIVAENSIPGSLGLYTAGFFLIRRSCWSFRFIDHWYALRHFMRVEGDQSGFTTAAVHGLLGKTLTTNITRLETLPCVLLQHDGMLTECWDQMTKIAYLRYGWQLFLRGSKPPAIPPTPVTARDTAVCPAASFGSSLISSPGVNWRIPAKPAPLLHLAGAQKEVLPRCYPGLQMRLKMGGGQLSENATYAPMRSYRASCRINTKALSCTYRDCLCA